MQNEKQMESLPGEKTVTIAQKEVLNWDRVSKE
jgi:hypothetical protein